MGNWNDEKGYGFIRCNDGGEDVFLHRTALPQGEEVRDGDTIHFDETYDDRKGKTRASNVSIEGYSRGDQGRDYGGRGRDSYRDRDRDYGGRDGGYGRGRSRSRDDRGRYDRGRDDRRGRDGRDRGGSGNDGGRSDYQSGKQSY